MNKLAFTLIVLLLTTYCMAQTTQTVYYNNKWLGKVVPQEKAKFMQKIVQNVDGTVTKEIVDLKHEQVISSKTYRGREPYGRWRYQQGNTFVELDYSFDLKYAESYCNHLPADTTDPFVDNYSLKYVAPIMEGDLNFYQYLVKNMIYPEEAKDKEITGKVALEFTLNSEAKIENIIIVKGSDVQLDKEAVRVIREMKFLTPPIFEGKPQGLCFKLPISFMLR